VVRALLILLAGAALLALVITLAVAVTPAHPAVPATVHTQPEPAGDGA